MISPQKLTLKAFSFIVETQDEFFRFLRLFCKFGNFLVLLSDTRLELLCFSRRKLRPEFLIFLKISF